MESYKIPFKFEYALAPESKALKISDNATEVAPFKVVKFTLEPPTAAWLAAFNSIVKDQIDKCHKLNVKPQYIVVSADDYKRLVASSKIVNLKYQYGLPLVVVNGAGMHSPQVVSTDQFFDLDYAKEDEIDKSMKSIFHDIAGSKYPDYKLPMPQYPKMGDKWNPKTVSKSKLAKTKGALIKHKQSTRKPNKHPNKNDFIL